MTSVDRIFDDLGGPASVGRMIGKSTEHAATMKRRGSIPIRYWERLVVEAAKAGVILTDTELRRAHAVTQTHEAAE
jgi:hypothetical protein